MKKKLGKYYYHEALDRTSMIMDIIDVIKRCRSRHICL